MQPLRAFAPTRVDRVDRLADERREGRADRVFGRRARIGQGRAGDEGLGERGGPDGGAGVGVGALFHAAGEAAHADEDPQPVDLRALGELAALQGVVKFPVRIKCATLSWNTLTQGLDDSGVSA